MTAAGDCLRAAGQPALRWQELYTGFYLERERLNGDVLKSFAGILLIAGDCSIEVQQFKLQLNYATGVRSTVKRRTKP
jgi:hypothetical protein